jgi:hypothetical protein
MRLKAFVVLTVLSLVLAPAAQAQTASFAMPSCAAMAVQAGTDHSCCADKCDCRIESRSDELSGTLPASFVQPELKAARLEAQPLSTPVTGATSSASAEEDPPAPQAPLYQAYSDYRL